MIVTDSIGWRSCFNAIRLNDFKIRYLVCVNKLCLTIHQGGYISACSSGRKERVEKFIPLGTTSVTDPCIFISCDNDFVTHSAQSSTCSILSWNDLSILWTYITTNSPMLWLRCDSIMFLPSENARNIFCCIPFFFPWALCVIIHLSALPFPSKQSTPGDHMAQMHCRLSWFPAPPFPTHILLHCPSFSLTTFSAQDPC